jgi:ECF transporter S component (folate family)
MRKTYITVFCGIFIAMQVILKNYLSINTGILRIGFSFIPIAIGGALFGPLWNGVICAIADIAGFLIAPAPAPYFPGFTLSAFLSGAVYGFFLKAAATPRGTKNKAAGSQRGGGGKGTTAAQRGDGGKGTTAAQRVDGATDAAGFAGFEEPLLRLFPLSTTRGLITRTSVAAVCVTMLINTLLNTLWISILYNTSYIILLPNRFITNIIMLPVHIVVFGAIWRSLGKYIESTVSPKINAA